MEAIETYMSLLKDMPQKANRLDGIQSGLLESLTSYRSNFRSIGTTIRNWGNQGFKEYPKIRQKHVYESSNFNDIVRFYNNYIKGKPYTLAIVGNKEKIDFDKLSS